MKATDRIAHYHLPGLFEFYDLYKAFLPLYREHRDWFYPWCDIASLYGSPADCLWGGGRTGFGDARVKDVISLVDEYNISARLTFSNSLLKKEHLTDKKCNALCEQFQKTKAKSGVIVYCDVLVAYLREKFPDLYLVSSTTKVLTDFADFEAELNREDFSYVVPDFRLNKDFEHLTALSQAQKDKTEFLCNECCSVNCKARKACYENVSLRNLGEEVKEHHCVSPDASGGYRFSLAMKNPAFIGIDDIQKIYLPRGFSSFKIEGRGLGSALILEFLLYYLTKSEYHINVREAIYLDAMLDLF